MEYTFKEICKELDKDFDFSKGNSKLIEKAAAAARQLEFSLYSIGDDTLEIQEPTWPYRRHQYINLKAKDELTRTIVLTHAILNCELHDS